jgi:hypothetical protein
MLLLPLLILGNTGCLVFDQETAVLVFPPDSQEVRCLFVCEGLHVQGGKASDLQNAKEQLTSWAEAGQKFYLGPMWFAHVNLEPDESDNADTQAHKAALRKHLTVNAGAFFLNTAGKLCFYQTVTIRDRGKFTAEMNDLIGSDMAKFAALAMVEPTQRPEWCDEETLRLIQKAGDRPFAWFEMEPGRVSLSLPASPTAVARLKHEILKECSSKLLADQPLSFDHRKDRIRFSLGYGDGEPIRYDLDSDNTAPPHYEQELIDHARSLKVVTFKKGVTKEGLVQEFLKAQGKLKKP